MTLWLLSRPSPQLTHQLLLSLKLQFVGDGDVDRYLTLFHLFWLCCMSVGRLEWMMPLWSWLRLEALWCALKRHLLAKGNALKYTWERWACMMSVILTVSPSLHSPRSRSPSAHMTVGGCPSVTSLWPPSLTRHHWCEQHTSSAFSTVKTEVLEVTALHSFIPLRNLWGCDLWIQRIWTSYFQCIVNNVAVGVVFLKICFVGFALGE